MPPCAKRSDYFSAEVRRRVVERAPDLVSDSGSDAEGVCAGLPLMKFHGHIAAAAAKGLAVPS